jgi:2-keto-4-pentenoate hydratase/2-oxohepta-3-ene-1,7-dioic acid hydratase in catechol pathway
MKHVRFTTANDDAIRNGIIEGNQIRECTGVIFQSVKVTDRLYPLDQVVLLAPLIPRHIIGIGKNFVPEGALKPDVPDMPVLFFKPSTTVIGPNEPIVLLPNMKNTKFESELAVIIGKEAKRILPADVDNYIFGYTVANDVGASDYYHPDGHWAIGKSFDTFCPLGPWIDTEFDIHHTRIRSHLNGIKKQDSSLEQMIMPINQIVSYISHFMSLMPGDVILTGTPAGAVELQDGDLIECMVEGLGSISNPVRVLN